MPNRSARFLRFSTSESAGVTFGGGVAGLVTGCLDSFGTGGGIMTGWSTFQSTLNIAASEKRIGIRESLTTPLGALTSRLVDTRRDRHPGLVCWLEFWR